MQTLLSRQWASLAFLLCFSATLAYAQSTATGTVSGQITDQQGAVIVGAEIRLVDTQTNSARTTVSNESGRYSFINVPPGTYDILVGKPGFAQAKTAATVEVGLT